MENCYVFKSYVSQYEKIREEKQVSQGQPLYQFQIIQTWLVWLSGLSADLQAKGSPVQFLVRAHGWVAGQVPSRGCTRGNHTLMFLSLSFSLPFPLSKNKFYKQISKIIQKQDRTERAELLIVTLLEEPSPSQL